MLDSSIVLGTETFSATVVKPKSTLRANAARKLEDPATLFISHETQKNGTVSSVAIIDDTETVPCNDACQITPGSSTVRAMFKLQYDPTSGRPDLVIACNAVIAEMILLLSDVNIMDQFINQEH